MRQTHSKYGSCLCLRYASMTAHSHLAHGMLSGEHNVKNCHYILHIHRRDCAAISRHACEHTALSVILQEDCGGHPSDFVTAHIPLTKVVKQELQGRQCLLICQQALKQLTTYKLCLAELEALLLNQSQHCHSVCRQV